MPEPERRTAQPAEDTGPTGAEEEAAGLADMLAGLIGERTATLCCGDDARHVIVTAEADGARIVGQTCSTWQSVDPADWWAEVHAGTPEETAARSGDEDDLDLGAAADALGWIVVESDARAAVDNLVGEVRRIRGQRAALRHALERKTAAWCRQVSEAQRLIRHVTETDVLGLHPDGRRMLGDALAVLAEVQDPAMTPPEVDTAGLADRGGLVASLAAEVDWLRDQRADLQKALAVAEAERDRLREVRVDLIGSLDRIAERGGASQDETDAARDSEFDVCVNCDSVEIALAAGVRHGDANSRRPSESWSGDLAAVNAALDEALPDRGRNRPAAFYVRHLAAQRDAALAAGEDR